MSKTIAIQKQERKAQLINELKQRSSFINYFDLAVNQKGALIQRNAEEDFNNRIISGYVLVWGSRNKHGEIFVKGCCANSINQRGINSVSNYKIQFLWQHDSDDPLSLVELTEDDFGLHFRTRPLDAVPNAERALLQVKSGTINQFSAGFNYIWDKIEYDEATDSLILREIELIEISVVSRASEGNTFAFRSIEQYNDLNDDIETFISSLPRDKKIQARKLFSLQKTLIPDEPFKDIQRDAKPPESKIDLNRLSTLFND